MFLVSIVKEVEIFAEQNKVQSPLQGLSFQWEGMQAEGQSPSLKQPQKLCTVLSVTSTSQKRKRSQSLMKYISEIGKGKEAVVNFFLLAHHQSSNKKTVLKALWSAQLGHSRPSWNYSGNPEQVSKATHWTWLTSIPWARRKETLNQT